MSDQRSRESSLALVFKTQRMFRLGADPESRIFKDVAIRVHHFAVQAHTLWIKDAIGEAKHVTIMPGTIYYENTLMTKQGYRQFTEAQAIDFIKKHGSKTFFLMEYYKWINNNQLKNLPHKNEVYVQSSHNTKTSPFFLHLVLCLFGNLSNVLTNMEDLIINVVSAKNSRIGLSYRANALLQQHVETMYNNHCVSFYSAELRRVLGEIDLMSDAASDAGSKGSTALASDPMILVDVPPCWAAHKLRTPLRSIIETFEDCDLRRLPFSVGAIRTTCWRAIKKEISKFASTVFKSADGLDKFRAISAEEYYALRSVKNRPTGREANQENSSSSSSNVGVNMDIDESLLNFAKPCGNRSLWYEDPKK